MKRTGLNKKYLRAQTFWDVDFDALDVEMDRNFIISRVVQRGSDLEIMYLNFLLGSDEIYKVLENYMGVPEPVLAYYKTMKDASSR